MLCKAQTESTPTWVMRSVWSWWEQWSRPQHRASSLLLDQDVNVSIIYPWTLNLIPPSMTSSFNVAAVNFRRIRVLASHICITSICHIFLIKVRTPISIHNPYLGQVWDKTASCKMEKLKQSMHPYTAILNQIYSNLCYFLLLSPVYCYYIPASDLRDKWLQHRIVIFR